MAGTTVRTAMASRQLPPTKQRNPHVNTHILPAVAAITVLVTTATWGFVTLLSEIAQQQADTDA